MRSTPLRPTPFCPTLLCLTLLCALSAAHAQDRPNALGMNVHLASDDALDATAALGVGWVRVDNNWWSVELAEGQRDWAALDRVVNGAARRGLRIYMTIAYTPAWAATGGGDDSTLNDTPRPGTYAAYVRATVERYRDRVQHYGIWNEPNLEHFFEGSTAEYIDSIVRPGAAAVRAACPACQVLGPDLAGLSGWQPYLAEVLRGAPDAFDIIAHHSYARVPGVGGALWACDDFEHAIDIRADAICFYKPGLRQVLDDAGWDGDVWMTEVGYQTQPFDDDEQLEWQRLTVESVLALQRRTPWWTHSFFYEIADCGPTQPGCPIDGFGLLRRTADPDGTWADNFIIKPAFAWLRDTLAGPDWQDPIDPGPIEPPPSVLIEAPQRDAGLPDGVLDDWDADGCVILDSWVAVDAEPRPAAGDFSARACAAWSEAALWLAVDVRDDRHQNAEAALTLWQADSMQMAIDVDRDGRPGVGYDDDDSEWTIALSSGQSVMRIEHGERAALGVVRRDGDRTVYEFRVPLRGLRAGRTLAASFLVNERDDRAREGWLEWTTGIGGDKRPAEFGTLRLVARPAQPPPELPVDMGMDPAPDAGISADAGRAADAAARDGATPADDGRDAQGDPRSDGGPIAGSFVDRAAGADGGCTQAPGSDAPASSDASGIWTLALLIGVRRRRRR
ncbi:MAG: hypothetical protein ACI9U2_000115 [Bradymonadia bacterium]|jgi:hypothetical protein